MVKQKQEADRIIRLFYWRIKTTNLGLISSKELAIIHVEDMIKELSEFDNEFEESRYAESRVKFFNEVIEEIKKY